MGFPRYGAGGKPDIESVLAPDHLFHGTKLRPIPDNCFLRSPSVVQDAVEFEPETSASAGDVDFNPPIQIRAPSERMSNLPRLFLVRITTTREHVEIISRVGDSNRPDVYPRRDNDWRTPGSLREETAFYINLLHRDFSLEAMGELVRAGGALVRACVSMGYAARQIQGHNFRSMEPVRRQIGYRRYLRPAISQHVVEIATTGVIPEYTATRNPLPRESGLPYYRSKSGPIVKKFRGLIREGK